MSGLLAALALNQGPVEQGRSWVGHLEACAPAPRRIGVSQVELFASLVRDDDARYWSTVDPRPVPPGLLMAYALPLPWSPTGSPPRPVWARIPLPGDTLINVTTSTVFHRDWHTADALSLGEEVVELSSEKQTRLGRGYFLTTRARYEIDGEPLADHTNVMLRYHSDSAGPAVSPDKPDHDKPEPAVEPELSLPVTRELCVQNVAATGDFFPGHYDPAYARQQGVPDTYLNTMFFHGLADQLARHRRPGCRLVRRDLAMLASAIVGDTLTAGTRVADDAVIVEAWTDRGVCARASVWFADAD